MRHPPVHPPGHFEHEERRRAIVGRLLGLAFLAGTFCLLVRDFGLWAGVVVWSPLPAGFLSWSLLRGGSGARLWVRDLVLREGPGEVRVFDNHPIHFDVEQDRIRLRAADVFLALDAAPDETTHRRLAIRFGKDGFFRVGEDGDWWFALDALLQWLETRAERHEPRAVHFRTWLVREVLPGLRRDGTAGG